MNRLLRVTSSSFFALLVIVSLSGCFNSNQYSVRGIVKGAKGKTLKFNKLNLNGFITLDSVQLDAEGDFDFSGERLSEPTFFTLSLDSKSITLLTDSNATVEVNTKFESFDKEYQVKNSVESENIRMLNEKLASVITELDQLQKEYIAASTDAQRAGILSQMEYKIVRHKQFIGDFVLKNPRSFASYYAIYQKYDNTSFVLNVLDKRDQIYFSTVATSLNLLYPNNERVINLYNYLLSVKQQERNARANEALKAVPAVGFPDLKIKNLEGREVMLSSLQGKVVLLTFWATWSKESFIFNKELKRVYKKYAGRGFEIYQVSLDQNRLYWEAGVKQDELPWINVCELTYPNSYAATIYNISVLPSNFLISRKGDIIGRDLSGSLLDEKIEKNL